MPFLNEEVTKRHMEYEKAAEEARGGTWGSEAQAKVEHELQKKAAADERAQAKADKAAQKAAAAEARAQAKAEKKAAKKGAKEDGKTGAKGPKLDAAEQEADGAAAEPTEASASWRRGWGLRSPRRAVAVEQAAPAAPQLTRHEPPAPAPTSWPELPAEEPGLAGAFARSREWLSQQGERLSLSGKGKEDGRESRASAKWL